jgi:hypothetical protein
MIAISRRKFAKLVPSYPVFLSPHVFPLLLLHDVVFNPAVRGKYHTHWLSNICLKSVCKSSFGGSVVTTLVSDLLFSWLPMYEHCVQAWDAAAL